MKAILKRSIIAVAIIIIRVLRATLFRQRYFAFLIPADAGSMGDQAMVQGILAYLKDQNKLEPKLYHTSSAEDWGARMDGVAQFDAAAILEFPSVGRVLSFLWSLRNAADFGILGADVIDGTYSEQIVFSRLFLLDIAARSGVTARLLGFSFFKPKSDAIVQAFRALPSSVKYFSRDPMSLERFKAVTGCDASLAADLAFLLSPLLISPTAKEAATWVSEQKSKGKRIVAINSNQLIAAQGRNQLDAAYAHCMAALVGEDPEIVFLLVPHDYREGGNDVLRLKAIHALLSPALQARCHIIDAPVYAAEIKALMADVEMAITGRMHAAIAALGQQTPVACVVYVGKFEGLMQHVDMTGNLVSLDDAENTDKLTRTALEVYKNRASYKDRIHIRLPAVLALSRRNFE